MYFVYAIDSLSRNYTYIGLSDNVDRRLEEHNKGSNKTAKPYRPFKLFYTEQFETRTEARQKKVFEIGHWPRILKKN
jgi:putative endonuclease